MAGDLKGLTVQIGGDVTPLGKALDTVKTKSSAAQKELKKIDDALKFNPGNTELLTQKQTVLAEKISATKDKLNLLKQAQEQASEALKRGDIGESEYRQLERDIIKTTSELNKLERESEKTKTAMENAGEGSKKAAKGVKDVGDEAKKAEKKASSFADVLKGSLAAQAIVAGVKAVANGIKSMFGALNDSAASLGELSDNAAKVGMSAEALQSWQYAAKMAGLETSQLIDAMKKQQTVFSSAKLGNADLADTYAKIGVDITTLTSAEGGFQAVINGLASCKDETTRNAVANKIFGESYANLAPLLALGASGIGELRQKAYDLGIVMSEDAVNAGDALSDELDTLGIVVDATKAKLVSGMVPAMRTYITEAERTLGSQKTQQSLKSLGSSIGEITGKALNLAASVLPKLADGLAFATKHGKELAVAAVAGAVAINGFSIASKAKVLIDGLTTSFKGFSAAIAANPVGLLITSISALISVLSIANAVIDDSVEQQKQLAESYRASADAAQDAQKSRAQAAQNLSSEYNHYRDLVAELDTLVDADGRVKSGYEERVALITGELSTATGKEIELIDGVISGYNDLAASINDVITLKQAEAYISTNQGNYEGAKTAVASTQRDSDGNYVAGSQAAAEEARANYQAAVDTYNQLLTLQGQKAELEKSYDPNNFYAYQTQLDALDRQIMQTASQLGVNATTSELAIQSAAEYVTAAKDTADAAAYAYDQNKAVISQFEDVQTAVWSDNAEAVAAALETATTAQMTAADATLSSLERQRDAALEEYNLYLEWSKQANSTVTAEDVSAKRTAAISAAIEAHKKMIAEGDQHTQAEIDASRAALESLLSEVAGMSQEEIAKMITQAETDATEAGNSYVYGVVRGIKQKAYQAYQAGFDLGKEVDQGYRDATETQPTDPEHPKRGGVRSGAWYPIDGYSQDAVQEVVKLANQIDSAMRGGIPSYVMDYASYPGIMQRYDQYSQPAVYDLVAVNSRLDAIFSAIKAIDPALYVDGRLMSDVLSEHTDISLGKRVRNERRDALS